MNSLKNFTGGTREWIDNLSPTLWFKLEILSKGETWVLQDQEFLILLDQLASKVLTNEDFLEQIMLDDRFSLLIQVIAYMHISLVLRFCSIAPPALLFENNMLRWCVDNLENDQVHAVCKVLLARFDWLIQQDLNNRLFGKYTRRKIQKILSSIQR